MEEEEEGGSLGESFEIEDCFCNRKSGRKGTNGNRKGLVSILFDDSCNFISRNSKSRNESIDENKVERSNREKYYIHISCFK